MRRSSVLVGLTLMLHARSLLGQRNAEDVFFWSFMATTPPLALQVLRGVAAAPVRTSPTYRVGFFFL